MKLYPVPGGGWEGTEADWKKAMKAKGLDPKAFEDRKTREVPTGKKELMEFLTFFQVDVIRLDAGDIVVAPAVDLAELQAKHNPTPAEQVRDAVGTGGVPDEGGLAADSEATKQIAAMDNPNLDIDGIIETIFQAKGALLKRFAGAVAGAFARLAE
jgi:hypothetical protein